MFPPNVSRIVPSISFFAFVWMSGSACLAQKPVTSAEPTQRLSEIVPPRIADFLATAGSDRLVDAETADEVSKLFADDPQEDELLRILRPSVAIGSSAPVRLELSIHDNSRGDCDVRLVAGNNVHLASGVVVEPGGELSIGDVVTLGVVLNAGSAPIALARGDTLVQFAPGAFLDVSCQPCRTECRSGYYACCSIDSNGCCHCDCVPDGESRNCSSGGGPGSSACECGRKHIPLPDIDTLQND